MNHVRMEERITLQARVNNRLPSGENKYTWANLPTNPEVWAEVNPQRGEQHFAAAQQQVENPLAFRIYWRDDIDATMRVLWRGQACDITAAPVEPYGARKFLWLYTVAGVRDGR
jgi:SPP1 family predicted phage head-tail adaptor